MYKGKFLANAPEEVPAPRKKKTGTVVFYSLYLCFVALCLIAIFTQLLPPLNRWLAEYEASQPENKSAQVFAQLFEKPDWAALYIQAGIEDTAFENKDTYAAYMQEKVGTARLTCTETSAGLSGDRKYILRLGEEKIASYTLKETTGGKEPIAKWELGKLELFFARTNGVTVEKRPEQTVYINGVPLDDSYTVSRTDTLAQSHLPQGVNGFCLERQHIEGLLMPPAVEIRDAAGNPVALAADEEGVLRVELPAMEISQEEKSLAIDAAKANALFAIRAISTGKLQQHFDKDSQIYKDTCATAVFIQDYTGYGFDDSVTAVSDYYRYSDMLFSARVTLEMNVTRTNGTVKTFHADTTYFFTKNSQGKYLVTDITNVDIQAHKTQVRLDFVTEQGTASQFVAADSAVLTLPEAAAPQGQVLSGWATKTQADGKQVMTVVFTTENGNTVTLDPEKPLVPMVLYPVFAKAG